MLFFAGQHELAYGQVSVTISRLGGELIINPGTAALQADPSVASLATGEATVVWSGRVVGGESNTLIQARSVSQTGLLGPEVLISTEFSREYHGFPEVAKAGANELVVAWEDFGQDDGSEEGIFGRRLDAVLTPLGEREFQVNTFTEFTQQIPDVAADAAGNFLVTWYDSGSVFGDPKSEVKGRLYDPSGNPRGDEFVIATTHEGYPFGGRVAAFCDGGFVVTWTAATEDLDHENILVATYDAAGNRLLSRRANRRVRKLQRWSDVATCDDGRFLVVWQAAGVAGERQVGVFGQWFSRDGNTLGDEFHANQYIRGIQNLPSAATTPSCQAIVIWPSDGQDGDQEGVFGRVFGPAGNALSDEFRLNTSTEGKQGTTDSRDMSVVAVSDDTFFATWATAKVTPIRLETDIRGQWFCLLQDNGPNVCGNSTCSGSNGNVNSINVSDALVALRAAVSIDTCLLCRCDVNGSGGITSADALAVMFAATGRLVDLNCPACSTPASQTGNEQR